MCSFRLHSIKFNLYQSRKSKGDTWISYTSHPYSPAVCDWSICTHWISICLREFPFTTDLYVSGRLFFGIWDPKKMVMQLGQLDRWRMRIAGANGKFPNCFCLQLNTQCHFFYQISIRSSLSTDCICLRPRSCEMRKFETSSGHVN